MKLTRDSTYAEILDGLPANERAHVMTSFLRAHRGAFDTVNLPETISVGTAILGLGFLAAAASPLWVRVLIPALLYLLLVRLLRRAFHKRNAEKLRAFVRQKNGEPDA